MSPQRIIPLWDRLLKKVQIPSRSDGCWIWIGAYSTKRRGQKRPIIREAGQGSRILNAARVVCEHYHGPPPSSFHEAGHTCPDGENFRCVAPEHLRWMSRVENEQYKSRRV